MTDEEKKASANRSDIAVATTTLGVAGIAALLGLPAEVGTILSSSGTLMALSKALHESEALQKCFGLRGAKRAFSTAGSLVEKAEAEGINPNPEKFAELLEEGLPFVGRAVAEEKRRMMDAVLMNGVRLLRQEGKKAEAMEALKLIEEIPETSLLIFASFLQRLKEFNTEFFDMYEAPIEKFIPNNGMNEYIHKKALDLILYGSGSLRTTLSCSFLIEIAARSGEISGKKSIYLTNSGKWLAEWVTDNPAISSNLPPVP